MESNNDPTPSIDSLKKEVKRLESLFENSSLNYQCLDNQGHILKISDFWLATLGYTEEEVLYKWFGDFLSDDSKTKFDLAYKSIKKSDSANHLELQIICKDASLIYADFTCLGTTINGGKNSGTHCVFQNITKLRLTEQALAASEKKYSQLVELSNVGIFELDPNQRKYTYVNEVIKRELGISEDELSSFTMEAFMTEEGRAKYAKRMSRLKDGEEISNIAEYEIINAPNGNKWVQINYSHLRDQKGNLRIIGVAQDITTRKKLELELKNYHTRLEHITHSSPGIIFQYRVENGKTSFNYLSPNIKELLGLSADEVLNDPEVLSSRIEPEDFKAIIEAIKKATREMSPAHISYRYRKSKDEVIWIRTILSAKKIDEHIRECTGVSTDITTEVELKEKLERSEQKYEALINSAAPGISTMSKAGIVSSVNPRLCAISGYEEEELVGKHFLKIPAFYKRDAPKYVKMFNDARKGIIPIEPVRFNWKHKDGSKRWGEGFLSTIVQNNKITGYQSVLTDITSRVLLEEAEKLRRDEMNFLFDSAFTLLNITEEQELYDFLADKVMELIPGAIVETNSISEDKKSLTIRSVRIPEKSKYEKVLKLLGNNMVGRVMHIPLSEFDYAITGRLFVHNHSIYELSHGRIPKFISDQIERVIGPGTIYEIPIGTEEHVLGSAAIYLKEGEQIKNPNIIETLFREASSAFFRLRAVKILDQNESLYRSLAENSGDWIIKFNTSYEHSYVNQAVANSFQLNPEDFIGKTCSDLGYSKEYSKLIESKLKESIESQLSTQCDIELTIEGETNFYEWCFFPETESEGVISSVMVNARNVTKRKKVEGELLESISKKNSLYSIISHDLRSPFNSILGFLNLMEKNYNSISDEKKLEYLKIIRDSAEGCLSLFNQILDWSTEYKSNDSIKPLFFDLNTLTNKVIDLARASIVEKQVTVKNEVQPDTLVHADYNMISTVLRNLLSNAIRYSSENGAIVISALDQKKHILCKVQDFGTGMSQETIARVLTMDAHSSSSNSINRDSFGLGLKLSKEFVESNNGKLWIEKGPESGIIAQFTLMK